MFDIGIYGAGLWTALGLALALWLASRARHDAGVIEPLWPLSALAMLLAYMMLAPALAERAYLLLFVATIWAVRLALFLLLRRWGEPGQGEGSGSGTEAASPPPVAGFSETFGLQAILAWIASLPLLVVVLSGAPLGAWDAAAVALWLVGFGFQAIGDQQLQSFQADPANRGRVLDRGLWHYTRHPNYFGEACIWWAYYLFAVAAGGWWSIASPLLVTFLLLRVSGVARLEQHIGERRPDYSDYKQRTNAFLPGRPRPRTTAR